MFSLHIICPGPVPVDSFFDSLPQEQSTSEPLLQPCQTDDRMSPSAATTSAPSISSLLISQGGRISPRVSLPVKNLSVELPPKPARKKGANRLPQSKTQNSTQEVNIPSLSSTEKSVDGVERESIRRPLSPGNSQGKLVRAQRKLMVVRLFLFYCFFFNNQKYI